jgi:hypothetical protein
MSNDFLWCWVVGVSLLLTLVSPVSFETWEEPIAVYLARHGVSKLKQLTNYLGRVL